MKQCLLADDNSTHEHRFFSQDPDLVIDQFLAWLHPDPSLQSARAPAEVMLLKSKPHFVRCRELQSQVNFITARLEGVGATRTAIRHHASRE